MAGKNGPEVLVLSAIVCFYKHSAWPFLILVLSLNVLPYDHDAVLPASDTA